VVLPDGTIVLMGGAHGRMNDVWRLETAGSYEQHPSHSYAEAGIYSVTLQAYNQGGSSRAHQDAYITVGWWMNLPLLMR
jgi:PKD repeat protein